MDDLMGVQVGQGLGYVVGDVDLNVEGEGHVGSLQKAGQALVHQFHEQNRQPRLGVSARAEVLDDVGVPHFAEELALLLEALHDATGGGVSGGEEDGVQYLSSAGELVTLGPVDGAVGANAEGIGPALDQLYATVAETTLDLQPLSHGDCRPHCVLLLPHSFLLLPH